VLVFKGEHPATYSFQGGDCLIFFQIGLLSSIEEKHVSLHRKTSMLEVSASSTLFVCKTELISEIILLAN
jgi:hypothetical protein